MRETKQVDKEINNVITNCARSSESHDAGVKIREQSLGQCRVYRAYSAVAAAASDRRAG